MTDLGPISEDEMVATFLQAEALSPRFKDKILLSAAKHHLTYEQLTNPDTTNAQVNKKRAKVLGDIRGYKHNLYIFAGLPTDLKWKKALIKRSDISRCFYADHDTWNTISRGTRKVDVEAENYHGRPEEQIGKNVPELIKEIHRGVPIPKIILLEDHKKIFVLEGHTRITAYANTLSDDAEIEVIVGYGRDLTQWAGY